MGTAKVLCRYWLHGACRFGDACTFSHSLEDSESQVCRYYLKGECAYGDRCRYEHVKPEWSAARRGGGDGASGSGYAAPAVPKPAADDLADQLPISRLRLGGQAAGAAPLPLPLPLDPFGAAGASTIGSGGQQQQQDAAGAAGDVQWQGQSHDQHDAWAAEQAEGQQWEEGGEWDEYGEGGEGDWEDYYAEEEGAYYGEGGGGEGEWGEEGWPAEDEAGQEGNWGAQQHGDMQPPGDGGAGQQAERAWAVPAALTDQQRWAASCPPSLRSLCQQWFRSGSCDQGAACKLVHGDLCPHCHKHALHPADASAREQHLSECKLRHERLAARARSAGIECGICLEPVLSKAVPGERRFGLLTGCDHPFCLRCIRSWRQKTDAGADIDTALRTCPVCRTTSHYIVPSMVWPSDAEDKERVVAGYKAKLGMIDCMHFNFGEGTCPFGTSCFYRHAYPDGRLEEPSLRHIVDDEGVRVVQPVRLCDFISISTAGQRLGSRRRQ